MSNESVRIISNSYFQSFRRSALLNFLLNAFICFHSELYRSVSFTMVMSTWLLMNGTYTSVHPEILMIPQRGCSGNGDELNLIGAMVCEVRGLETYQTLVVGVQ